MYMTVLVNDYSELSLNVYELSVYASELNDSDGREL